MTTDQAIKHFGTQVQLAQVLGITQSSISTWGKYPPALRQLQIEAATRGALRAERALDKYRVAA